MSATLYYISSVFMESCDSGDHVWANKNAVLPSSKYCTFSTANMRCAELCASYSQTVL